MKNSDTLFQWLDLNRNLRLLFENVKKYVQDKRGVFTNSLKNISKQILNKLWRSSDKDLANHGIKNRLYASVMTFVVCHNCEQVMEIDGAFKFASKDLMKMNHNILNLLNI